MNKDIFDFLEASRLLVEDIAEADVTKYVIVRDHTVSVLGMTNTLKSFGVGQHEIIRNYDDFKKLRVLDKNTDELIRDIVTVLFTYECDYGTNVIGQNKFFDNFVRRMKVSDRTRLFMRYMVLTDECSGELKFVTTLFRRSFFDLGNGKRDRKLTENVYNGILDFFLKQRNSCIVDIPVNIRYDHSFRATTKLLYGDKNMNEKLLTLIKRANFESEDYRSILTFAYGRQEKPYFPGDKTFEYLKSKI